MSDSTPPATNSTATATKAPTSKTNIYIYVTVGVVCFLSVICIIVVCVIQKKKKKALVKNERKVPETRRDDSDARKQKDSIDFLMNYKANQNKEGASKATTKNTNMFREFKRGTLTLDHEKRPETRKALGGEYKENGGRSNINKSFEENFVAGEEVDDGGDEEDALVEGETKSMDKNDVEAKDAGEEEHEDSQDTS